jgi:glycosyltransferase involved in cell wall biosynthesis
MNEPRRILHLIGRLDGYGGARMLRYLAASQAAAGDTVIVAALTAAEAPARELRKRGVAVHVLGSRWPVDFVALSRLARLRRRAAADIVHTWDIATLAQAAFTGQRGNGGMLIASLDTVQAERRWAARVARSSAKRIDAFAAADEFTRAWLKRLGAADDRIELIPPGVPRAAAAPQRRDEVRKQLSLPPEAPVIAVAGPLRRRKQIDEAIWCFELVRVLHENARLLVFGDGPDRTRLDRFAEEVSDPGCVRFLGYRGDLAELWPAVDVFWQLDSPVGTPLALLEAQAAGLPVVASDVLAHRAVISPDRTGLLTPLNARAEVARATDGLLSDPARARLLGAAAAEHAARQWSLDAALCCYQRLYDRLLAKTAG